MGVARFSEGLRCNSNDICNLADQRPFVPVRQSTRVAIFQARSRRQVGARGKLERGFADLFADLAVGPTMESPLICPSCKADIERRYACTNCGFVFGGQRCLLPSCKALNPPDAKFCGDCGSPLSISPRRWVSFLHLHQRIITHPYRDGTLFFSLIGALVVPLGVLLIRLMNSGGGIHRGEWNWIEALVIFVPPPTVAAFVVYVTYPNGGRIRAFLLGIVFELLAIMVVIAIAFQITQFIGRL
jgi:hypothetical protein